MTLPQREFYTLHEVAARWGCALADISGWSTAGELDVITGIPPTFCGTTRVAGTVVICTMDIVSMFRRCGTGPKNAQLRRLRTEETADWLFVTEPPQGVDVSIADLLLRSKQVLKFEDMRHDPAAGAIVIMLRSLKMYGMAQAVTDLIEQGAPAFEAAIPMLSQL
ncbi:MAG: hypothetical protein Q8K33_20810, partial [Cypionkella sp.]|nr:hypothetical protein [Cypionkella sp.]